MHKNFQSVFPDVFSLVKSDDKKHCAVDMFVYLYICYHYCLSKRSSISITYREIREGSLIDNGLGFSYSTIADSIKRLRKQKLIRTRKRKQKGNESSYVFRQEFQPKLPNGLSFESLETSFDNCSFDNQSDFDNCSIKYSKEYLKDISLENNYDENETTKPLLKKQQTKQQGPHICKSFARQLKYAIGKNNKTKRSVNIASWSNHISKFIEQQEDESFEARFGKVLAWYCDNMLEEYVPRIYSAKTFCDRFEAVEDAMRRQTKARVPHEDDLPEPPKEKKLTEEQEQHFRDSMSHLL